jgi:hypothetical protein
MVRRIQYNVQPVSVHVGFVLDKMVLGQIFLVSSSVFLSVSLHHGPPYSYIIWGMNVTPVCAADQRCNLIPWT